MLILEGNVAWTARFEGMQPTYIYIYVSLGGWLDSNVHWWMLCDHHESFNLLSARSSDNEMLASLSSTSFKPDCFSWHWHLPRGDLFFGSLVRVPLNLWMLQVDVFFGVKSTRKKKKKHKTNCPFNLVIALRWTQKGDKLPNSTAWKGIFHPSWC